MIVTFPIDEALKKTFNKMNTKTLNLHIITLVLIGTLPLFLFNCSERKPETNDLRDGEHQLPTDELLVNYQVFNLELAAEEAYHIRQFRSKLRDSGSMREEACILAINALRDPCDFTCEIFDLECLKKKFDCENTALVRRRTDSDDDDGDGAEPLPIASDTSLNVIFNLAALTVYSDKPQQTRLELRTADDEVYASTDDSPDDVLYDEEKRLVVFNISGKIPKPEMKQLTIYVNTAIVNAAGEIRSIKFKHTVELVSNK